jgi:hypothetical protein
VSRSRAASKQSVASLFSIHFFVSETNLMDDDEAASRRLWKLINQIDSLNPQRQRAERQGIIIASGHLTDMSVE